VSRFLAVTGGPASGHPIWHFAAVAGAGVLTYVGIKGWDWWRRRGPGLTAPSPALMLLAALGLVSCAVHIGVGPEHFEEWVVYGVFFVCASAAQAAWSVLILLRPSRRLLLYGAFGNLAVVMLFVGSRLIGIPFGPDAFQPEELSMVGIVATGSELLLVALALWMAQERVMEKSATDAEIPRFRSPRFGHNGPCSSGTGPSSVSPSVHPASRSASPATRTWSSSSR
jgi:hypothetical protein